MNAQAPVPVLQSLGLLGYEASACLAGRIPGIAGPAGGLTGADGFQLSRAAAAEAQYKAAETMVLSMVIARAKMKMSLELVLSQRITASQFKARCLALMDQVAATGEVLLITKNGRPVAELHPCASARRPSPFGLHPDVQLHGDVISPIETSWSVLQ